MVKQPPLKACAAAYVILLIILILPAKTIAQNRDVIEEAKKEFLNALSSVREAELVGCREEDLRVLVEKLNSALLLLDNAIKAYESGRSVEAKNSASLSREASLEVEAASEDLISKATQANSRFKVMLLIIVPSSALTTSIIIEILYSWWLEYSKRRLLKMRIKLRRED